MERADYKSIAKSLRPRRKLGQNFLLDRSVAIAEAEYGRNRRVVEMGPGLGMLTSELCKVAKRVVAIEKDSAVFSYLRENLNSRKLSLINKDFFDATDAELENPEIMISNVPYNLSSKVVMWLAERGIPAVLCLQKEFVDHMLAKEGTHEYSKLSVIVSVQFKVYRMMNVEPSSFYPEPKVSSAVIYLKPTGRAIDRESARVLNLLMMHKKRKVRNAVADSQHGLGLDGKDARMMGDSLKGADLRLFKLSPDRIVEIAEEVGKRVREFKTRR